MSARPVCSNCGSTNLGARFCEDCGTPVPTEVLAPTAVVTPEAASPSVPQATPSTVPLVAQRAGVGATPVRVLALLCFVLAGIVPSLVSYSAYSAGNYVPEFGNILSDTFVGATGFFAFIAALAGRATPAGKFLGAILALAYVGLMIFLVYGGVFEPTGYANEVLLGCAYLALFLSWGLGRPFRGPGYAGVIVLALVILISDLLAPLDLGGGNTFAYLGVLYAIFGVSTWLVVGLSVVFERVPRSAVIAVPGAVIPAPAVVSVAAPRTIAPTIAAHAEATKATEPAIPRVPFWDRPRAAATTSGVIGATTFVIVALIIASTAGRIASLDASSADIEGLPIESAGDEAPAPQPSVSLAESRIPSTCAELYSAGTAAAIQAAGFRLGTSARLNSPAGTSDLTLAGLMGGKPRLECTWHPSDANKAGLETSVVEIDAATTAAVTARLQALGYASLGELGGTRYFFEATGSDGVRYGESDMLRDGLWFATRWLQYGPDGYTADMVGQVFG